MFSNINTSFSVDIPVHGRERANSFIMERPQAPAARKKLSFDDVETNSSDITNDTDSLQSASFISNIKKNLSETSAKEIFQKPILISPKSDKEISFLSPIYKNSQRSFIIPPVFETDDDRENEKMECEDGPDSERYSQTQRSVGSARPRNILAPSYEAVLDALELNSPCFSTFGHSNFEDPTALEHLSNGLTPRGCDYEYIKKLPTTPRNSKNPDLTGITAETLTKLLNNDQNLKYLIIDCRYDYEYQGGHIEGAININSPELLENLFFKNKDLLKSPKFIEALKKDFHAALSVGMSNPEAFLDPEIMAHDNSPPMLIFHCEFSHKRGPRALRTLRNLDRKINAANWPKLDYPELYILEGGYRNFVSQSPECCEPKNSYIEMLDANCRELYAEAREREKILWKKKAIAESLPLVDDVQNPPGNRIFLFRNC